MPQILTDEQGNRVIIRHTGPIGPAGPGFPVGGDIGDIFVKTGVDDYDAGWAPPSSITGFVTGPVSSTDGNVVLFDGVTGLLLKDSGTAFTDLASKDYADAVSQENFTTTLKAKLDAIPTKNLFYRGYFVSMSALVAGVTDPAQGDYAVYDDTTLGDGRIAFYDLDTTSWRDISDYAAAVDGEEVALALFDDGATWSISDCNIFTDTYKGLVDSHEALLSSLLSGISNLGTYAGLYIHDGTYSHAGVTAYTQVIAFSQTGGNNGHSNNMTPDKTNNRITAMIAGHYQVTWSMSILVSANNSTVTGVIYAAESEAASTEASSTSSTSGASTKLMCISGNGFVELTAGQHLKLYMRASTSSDIVVEDCNITAVRVGD